METIAYAALLSGRYGYSESARDYDAAFARLSERVGFDYMRVDINTREGVQELLTTDWTGKHLILHKMPGQSHPEMMASIRKAKSFTYMTVWECNSIPTGWVSELQGATRIVTFSDFSASGFAPSFEKMKATLPPIMIIPHYLRAYEPDATVEDFKQLVDEKINVLFTASQLTERKGIDLIVKSFWSLEAAADRLRLIMKCPAGAQKYANAALPQHDRPEIVIIEDYLTNGQMDYLMSICPVYFSTARGEGFGLDVVRSGIAGLETYSTANSGPDSWLHSRNYHAIDSEMEPVVSVSTYSFANTKGMKWPVPRMSDVVGCLENINKVTPFDLESANSKITEFNSKADDYITALLKDIIKD